MEKNTNWMENIPVDLNHMGWKIELFSFKFNHICIILVSSSDFFEIACKFFFFL